eukprot:m51a1_g14050 hypothetical protein (319) ;mRNA; r:1194072-1195589
MSAEATGATPAAAESGGESARSRRFSWVSTRSRIALGAATLEVRPYAVARGRTEAAYEAMRSIVVQRLQLADGDTKPASSTVGEKYREILKQFRANGLKHAKGTGTASELAEFDQIWSRVSEDERHCEDADSRDDQRGEADGGGTEDEQLDARTEEDALRLSEGQVDAPVPFVAGAALSQQNKRAREFEAESPLSAPAAKLSRSEFGFIAQLLAEERMSRERMAAEARRTREAELAEQHTRFAEELELRRQELELERTKAANETKALDIRQQELNATKQRDSDMHQLLLALIGKQKDLLTAAPVSVATSKNLGGLYNI